MMDLNELLDDSVWNRFYEHVSGKNGWKEADINDLDEVIKQKSYRPFVQKIIDHDSFDPPVKHLISKNASGKKRIVYSYSQIETLILKVIAWRLHEYDYLFSDNLYSFRINQNPRNAFLYLTGKGLTAGKYSYKVDISNYFNSIPVDRMLEVLNERLNNEALCDFFATLLDDTRVMSDGEIINETKGIMAGTPTASFLANLYLADLDEMFADCVYARYSDDIILFADTEKERDTLADKLKFHLFSKGLAINTDKEIYTAPGEAWTFLGITRKGDISDISAISLSKLKGKLHRKARAIERWKRSKHATDEQAVKAFIKAVNRKLYDNKKTTELTWARWYFPLINTDESLKELDHYIQSCIRYVACGNYGKKAYNFTYDDMKRLGYRSLVHEYYMEK